eukprot:582893_1
MAAGTKYIFSLLWFTFGTMARMVIFFTVVISCAYSYTTCHDVWQQFIPIQKEHALLVESDTYTLSDNVTIRCCFVDLNNNTTFIGALIQHGSFNNHRGDLRCRLSAIANCTFNEDNLAVGETSLIYRWSRDRMIAYRNDSILQSTHNQSYLLMTCNKNLTLNRDYMLLPFDERFLYNQFWRECHNITRANIRGHECNNAVGNFWNSDHFSFQSSSCNCGDGCCEWDTDAVSSEDNFGLYKDYTKAFTCAESNTSTTDYWMGSIVDTSSTEGTQTSYDVFRNIEFDQISTETFGGIIPYDIGWKEVVFCDEGRGHMNQLQFISNNSAYAKAIAPFAITIKIVPEDTNATDFDEFAVYGKVCQNPIVAVNNFREISYEINVNTLAIDGFADISDWVGLSTAKDRLVNTCMESTLHAFDSRIYHACDEQNNISNIQIATLHNLTICEWKQNEIYGHNIAVYLGFDVGKSFICDGAGEGGLSETVRPTQAPTSPTYDPTSNPTIHPTSDPTIEPTYDPTYDPTIDPTRHPTIDPTMDPTIAPTLEPTYEPTTDPTKGPTTDPTNDPTSVPTIEPTRNPTIDPTIDPTKDPTSDPTLQPTLNPTLTPSLNPTPAPIDCPYNTFSFGESAACFYCDTDNIGYECKGQNILIIQFGFWVSAKANNSTKMDEFISLVDERFDAEHFSLVSFRCPHGQCCSDNDGCSYYDANKISTSLCAAGRNVSCITCSECNHGLYRLVGTPACGHCEHTNYPLLVVPISLAFIFAIFMIFIFSRPIDVLSEAKEIDWRRILKKDQSDIINILVFKITLYYYQSLSQILSTKNITPRTQIERTLFAAANFEIFSVSSGLSGFCFIGQIESGLHQLLISQLFYPFLITDLLIISIISRFYNITLHSFCCCFKSLKSYKPYIKTGVINILMMSAAPLLSLCFKLLTCIDIDSNYYHFYDANKQCFKLLWFLALICTLLICIIFFIFWYRIRHQTSEQRGNVSNQYKSLINKYTSSAWFWEFILFARRFVIAFFTAIETTSISSSILGLWITGLLMLQVHFKPFRYSRANSIEAFCLMCLVSIILSLNIPASGAYAQAMSLYILILIVMPLIMVFLLTVHIMCRWYKFKMTRNADISFSKETSAIRKAVSRMPTMYRASLQEEIEMQLQGSERKDTMKRSEFEGEGDVHYAHDTVVDEVTRKVTVEVETLVTDNEHLNASVSSSIDIVFTPE